MSDLRGGGGPWELSRDGIPKGRYPTEIAAIGDLHRLVGYSADHAFKNEGWSLEYKAVEIEIVASDEETKTLHLEVTLHDVPVIRERGSHEED